MAPPVQNFVILRQEQGWPRARLTGLEIDPAGAASLAQVPAAASGPVIVSPPYDPALTGFAVSPCGEVLLASPLDSTILFADTRCADHRLVLSAASPCDPESALQSLDCLAAGGDRLYVVDEKTARVRVFTLPGLALSMSWEGPFIAPRRIALDAAGRAYVLDVGLKKLLRLDSSGRVDPAYETGEVAALEDALDVFVSSDGTAFVSVADAGDILRFSPMGASLDSLVPPEGTVRPGALAGDMRFMYVADRASGLIWVYDVGVRRWLVSLPHFRAPVAGLATDGDGHLYVRTEAGVGYLRLDARRSYLSRGLLEAGPFDAGESCAWMRVHVDADVPEATRLRIETALADRVDGNVPLTWRTAPALDLLVHSPTPADVPADADARFLWIRVHVESDDPGRSPRLTQIVAETPGEDYMSKLPAVYARTDAESNGFLRRFLEAFRAELGDRELQIASLAQRLDPAMAPGTYLEWLASWVALDLPPDGEVTRWRALLLDAHRLYERRGTVQGLRAMVRTYAGVDCEIVESFRARRLWALDGSARLGFETALLPALPDGMVVPGPSIPEPSLQGLRAEYFLDDHLGVSAEAPDRGGDRCEPRFAQPNGVDADGRFPAFKVPSPPPTAVLDAFSVLWTGQLRPRYSELYSFHFAHDGGARLYVDDQLLVDSWITPGNREPRGSLPLRAERWYRIRLEYWSDNLGAAAPRLSWSSRSQHKQIVPQECLYAVADDNINPEARRTDGGPEAMVVGETVVGAHGPLAPEEFGTLLFDDTAHHFTVRVNAAQTRSAATLESIRAVLNAEKPAHTDYHLCVVAPTFLVGTQARVGIDAFVAPAPPPGYYDEGRLELDARLGVSTEHDAGTLRVDETRVGSDAILR